MTGKPRHRIVEFPQQLSRVQLNEQVGVANWPTEQSQHLQDLVYSSVELPVALSLADVCTLVLSHAYPKEEL